MSWDDVSGILSVSTTPHEMSALAAFDYGNFEITKRWGKGNGLRLRSALRVDAVCLDKISTSSIYQLDDQGGHFDKLSTSVDPVW